LTFHEKHQPQTGNQFIVRTEILQKAQEGAMMIKKAQKAGFMKYNQASWEIRMMRGK
jgi:hypothetical protein